jgi:hypothetical protein
LKCARSSRRFLYPLPTRAQARRRFGAERTFVVMNTPALRRVDALARLVSSAELAHSHAGVDRRGSILPAGGPFRKTSRNLPCRAPVAPEHLAEAPYARFAAEDPLPALAQQADSPPQPRSTPPCADPPSRPRPPGSRTHPASKKPRAVAHAWTLVEVIAGAESQDWRRPNNIDVGGGTTGLLRHRRAGAVSKSSWCEASPPAISILPRR